MRYKKRLGSLCLSSPSPLTRNVSLFRFNASRLILERAKGFEPLTTCLGSPLGNYSMRHARTQRATGRQQQQGIPVTARYRPQEQDTGATVTKTGMYGWNRDGDRNGV